LRLTVDDYDPRQGTLLIRCTKFHKSRLLPLHKDVCREVEHYLNIRRKHHLSIAAETPLVGSSYGGGSPYTPQSLRWGLERLLRWAKIRTSQGRLPRTHDARHSFAVNALLRWYRSGVDVQSKLPFLAAYMGHVSIVSTYHYLHFVEPLASQASARFAQCYGSLVNDLRKAKGVSR
jgi:integrase